MRFKEQEKRLNLQEHEDDYELVIQKFTQIIEKYQSNHLLFVEEGPDLALEDIKSECNVNCFEFFFFSVFFMDVTGGKITINLKELH